MPTNGSCMIYGPAQRIAEMRAEGIPYPPYELPAVRPPSELNVMPVNIAKINLPDEQPSPIYSSFEDAVAGANPVNRISAGRLRYVSYINRRDHQGKAFVQLASGGWTRAAPIAYTRYQGWEFSENPRHDFGWIVSFIPVQSRQGPSNSEPGTGNFYERDDQFFVYERSGSETDELVWYRIGHNEWINSQMARVVDVNPKRPEGVSVDRWIELNLFQQTIKVYEDGRLLFAALVATGIDPFFTQPGVFQIYDMRELDTMQGAFEADRSDFYYLEDVPWAIYYDQNRAIHATYWSFPYGYPQSHGCVNLSPGDADGYLNGLKWAIMSGCMIPAGRHRLIRIITVRVRHKITVNQG
jgi:hypothetical protein